MKKTNILTSILNIIIQIANLIWFFVYYDTYAFSDIMSILNISFFAMCLFMGQVIVMFIINLVVGIKNRKKSTTNLVIYIIIAVLFIIQPLFLYLEEVMIDDWYGIVVIASYFLIYALDIFTFIWTLIKVPKSEKKTKYDTIIFVIVIITVILCLITPLIWSLSITKKFEEAATDELNETNYIIFKKGNTYSFMNENEEIEFSINASDCAREEDFYVFENGKKIKFINIVDNGVLKAIDINDPKNLKEIYSCKSMNGDAIQGFFNKFVKAADKSGNYYSRKDEEIAGNKLYKDEEVSKYKNYENSSDYMYTYYSNSEITVQVADLKENVKLVNDNEEVKEEPLQREIYLINNYGKDKIKLNCEDLMYRTDEDTIGKYIYLHDDKYIAFINKNKNTNGYFNLQGEQVAEIINNYVFLDINETCSLVARVTDRNKAVVKDDIDGTNIDYLYVQCMLINNDLKIISNEYNNVNIYGDFYILGNTLLNKDGEILNKDISEIEGTFYNGKMIVIKDNETKEYQLWDKNHQITSCDYIVNQPYYYYYYYNPYGIQIDEIYAQALNQM